MTLSPERLWILREKVHAIADRIAQDDRDLAEPLYRCCDELDRRRQEIVRGVRPTDRVNA